MGATYFLLLSSLGLAVVTQAQDCSKPVGGDNMNLKDEFILLETFQDGTKVSFACNIGYISAGGSPVITCTAGTWSPVRLKCERRNCGAAEEVPDGYIEYPEGTKFGDQLVVTCKSGFMLVGNNKRRCGAQGWMGRMPECEPVTCDPPPPVESGTFRPDKETYRHGEVVEYSCKNDYTLSGSKTITCSDSGRFEPAPPTCVKVQCEEPVIANAEWIGGSRPPHGHLSTVTYKCKSGYTMIGEATLTCGIGGQWSPELPACQQLTTPKPTTTTTTKHPSTKKPAHTTAKPTPPTEPSHTTAKPTPPTEPSGPDTTDPPGNNGSNQALGWGIGVPLGILALGAGGWFFYGVSKSGKKKRGSRSSIPDNVVPKQGEDLALA